jgi:hypothetical protein
MNDLYVISNDEFLLVDDVAQIEGNDDLRGFDDLQSLDLDEPGRKKRVEHRRHKRFHLREDAFALIRSISVEPLNIQGKSMGCIACAVFDSRPARLGKIDNICMGGLMFQHVAGKTKLDRTLVLEILLADCGFYLANMPFEIKADVVLPDDIPDSPVEMRQVRLQFQNLSANQQAKLNELLLNNGTEVDINVPNLKT